MIVRKFLTYTSMSKKLHKNSLNDNLVYDRLGVAFVIAAYALLIAAYNIVILARQMYLISRGITLDERKRVARE